MIITIATQKGGSGKTSTAINLAAGIYRATSDRVLLVDIDPQSSATWAISGLIDHTHTIYDLLLNDDINLDDCIVGTRLQEGIDLIPSTIDLSGAEMELSRVIGGQSRLAKGLEGNTYRWVIIDTPPSLGYLTVNGLHAANQVLIPVGVSAFGLRGLSLLEGTIKQVQSNLGRPDLRIGGILATMTDQTVVSRDVVSALESRYPDILFNTHIPRNVSIEESHSRHTSIYTHTPDATGSIAYANFTLEVLERGKED